MKRVRKRKKAVLLMIMGNRKAGFEMTIESFRSAPLGLDLPGEPMRMHAEFIYFAPPKALSTTRQLRKRLRELTVGKQ